MIIKAKVKKREGGSQLLTWANTNVIRSEEFSCVTSVAVSVGPGQASDKGSAVQSERRAEELGAAERGVSSGSTSGALYWCVP
jgi:hypothetical protein